MNKNGFTLVELIAVIVLITIVAMLTFPAIDNLKNNNNDKEFTTYKDMMVEYVKVIPNYKSKSYICLQELGIKKINEKMRCNGYVDISGNNLTPHLSCNDENGNNIYKSTGFVNKGCGDY